MSPSRHHEIMKTLLARLLEAYAEEEDIRLDGNGSWTLKRKKKEAGAEPDECYVVGAHEVDRPDVAIEVVWTSGGLPKLEVYRRLRVREVWFYRDGSLRFYALGRSAYREIRRSRILPGFVPELIAPFMGQTDQTRAVRAFRKALKARHTGRRA
jgi:Uma2 family endonuclease